MKKIVEHLEWFIVLGIATFVSILNLLPVIKEWLKNPPDRYFVGITHFFADYFLYIAQMKQGAAGSLLYFHSFTGEPVPPTWLYWFERVLGFLGHTAGFSVFSTYTLALFVLVIGYLALIYFLLTKLYPTSRIHQATGYLFIITASPFYSISDLISRHIIVTPAYLWFSPGVAFQRLGGVPHQVFQNILFIALILLYAAAISGGKRIRWGSFFALLVLVPMATSLNPIQMLVFVLAACGVTAILFTKKPNPRLFVYPSVLLGSSFLAAILTYIQYETPVLALSKVWEQAQYVDRSLVSLFQAGGPILFVAPFGIVPFLVSKKPLQTMIVLYATTGIILFLSPLPALLHTTPIRYLHPANYIALPILAAEGVLWLSQLFGKILKIKTRAIVGIFVLLYLILTIPSLVHELVNRISPAYNPNLLLNTKYNHIPMPIVDALGFLGSLPTDPARPVVLVDNNEPIEILVPAFANKIVFSGHPLHTISPDIKESLRKKFFSNQMDEASARTFLQSHRISYIVASNSDATHEALRQLHFLTLLYSNPTIVIIKISL